MMAKSKQEGVPADPEEKLLCDLDSTYAYAAAILAELLEKRKKAPQAQDTESSNSP